jgi:hypothetical protein
MKTMLVYQSETDQEIEMEVIGLLKYVGNTILMCLEDGKTYACVGIDELDYFRIVDDTGEDYMYPIDNPRPLAGNGVSDKELMGGEWEVIDDPSGRLAEVIKLSKAV